MTELKHLSSAERRSVKLLLVEPDSSLKGQLLSALRTLGFGHIGESSDHGSALEALRSEAYSHLIFSTTASSISAAEFLAQAVSEHPEIIALPSSANPNVDEVFDLLMLGARAYLLIPITTQSLENVITSATRIGPLREAPPKAAPPEAADKNRAIADMLLTCLDDIATEMRRAKDCGSEPEGLLELMSKFRDTAEMAQAFTTGGELALLEALEQVSIEKADAKSATRLGRIRKRLALIRKAEREARSEKRLLH